MSIISTLELLQEDIQELYEQKNRIEGGLDLLTKEYKDRLSKTEDLEYIHDIAEKASQFLRLCSQNIRTDCCKKLEEAVTEAIRIITGKPYKFIVDLKQSRDQWVADFLITNPEGETVSLDGGSGGGIENIVGFMLQLVLLEMYPEEIKTPLVLDEPFSNLSLEYPEWMERLSSFLQQIFERTSRQIIMITHNTDFLDVCDKAYRITKEHGYSEAEQIK